jgi:glycosyltransferase involved in cell wall biosynthesis
MTDSPLVSFCATNLNTADRLPASLASIDRIGEDLGAPYEIVVADGPSTDGARSLLEARARASPTFHLVPHEERNRGYGRRRAFEASRGPVVVPFDTSLVYLPVYAGLLRAYLSAERESMLFSEISALPRRSVEAVGGWRDLVGGEDIDLYIRVIRRFGVLAYPTGLRGSQSHRLGAFDRQMRYVEGSRLRRYRRMYVVQRDQIIGANYRVRDLMMFNRRRSRSRRAALRIFFTAAYLGSRLRPFKPVALPENNYLLFREALLESMRRGDYRSLGWDGPQPQLLLTEDEVDYLRQACGRWGEYESLDPPILGVK